MKNTVRMTERERIPPPTGKDPIRVVVAGPDGRMGRVLMAGLPGQAGLEVVGGLRRAGDPSTAASLLAAADVLVDFTHADSAPELLLRSIAAGVRPVSGTSGMPEDALVAIDAAARERGLGAVWAPLFRLGGVLMLHFARIAARYFDAVEIVEGHHATKADAPSGTALELARLMRAEHGGDFHAPPVQRETATGARGGVEAGVHIHSLRLPDVLGWHDLVFGGEQELLTIGHHEFTREAYVPTVARAVRKVMEPGVVGLLRGYGAVIGLPA
jgi:4-hydroxy-tetrahydrodipicolinate reductase